LFVTTCLICSWAAAAAAQPLDSSPADQPAQSFEELRKRVALGDTLYVVDAAGDETKGRLTSLRDVALTLAVDGARQQFAAADVMQIVRTRRDPVRNGILTGLGAGAVAGFALGRTWDSPTCPRAGVECGQGAMTGAIGGAFWGAVGGWITDALIRKRETIYTR